MRTQSTELNVRVSPALKDALETIRQRDGIAKSEQIRRALVAWVEGREALHKRMQQAARKGAAR